MSTATTAVLRFCERFDLWLFIARDRVVRLSALELTLSLAVEKFVNHVWASEAEILSFRRVSNLEVLEESSVCASHEV